MHTQLGRLTFQGNWGCCFLTQNLYNHIMYNIIHVISLTFLVADNKEEKQHAHTFIEDTPFSYAVNYRTKPNHGHNYPRDLVHYTSPPTRIFYYFVKWRMLDFANFQ